MKINQQHNSLNLRINNLQRINTMYPTNLYFALGLEQRIDTSNEEKIGKKVGLEALDKYPSGNL